MQQDDRHGDRLTIALVRANSIKPQGLPLFKAKIPGAGAICPNNKNRNFATADNTKPTLGERPKGHLYSLLAQMITKERAGPMFRRAPRLEGGFATNKTMH